MEYCDLNDTIDLTPKEKEIFINGIKYSVSINKSQNKNDSLIIKIFDPNNKIDIYFTYEASIQKLKNDIKYLLLFETLEEMINSLNNIFNIGNACVEKDKDNYFLKLKFTVNGIIKISIVQLTIHKLTKDTIENRLNELENKYNELINKYNELKQEKEDNIKNIVNQTIFNIILLFILQIILLLILLLILLFILLFILLIILLFMLLFVLL